MSECPACGLDGDRLIGVEYAYGHPERYDGVSEWMCPDCGTRVGRWSGRVLLSGDFERRFDRRADAQASAGGKHR